jgi:AcrR family transcriptional regulator
MIHYPIANQGSFMQYRKKETKNSIISAALKEFGAKGYLDASMRDIARNAGVSVGNIYRYFKNKSELFDEIIEPAYFRLMLEMREPRYSRPDYSVSQIDDTVDRVMKVLKQYKKQLVILGDKSKGTKYERTKEEFVLYVESSLKNRLLPVLNGKGVKVHDPFVFYLLSSTFMEGYFTILRRYDNPAKMRYLIRELIILLFGAIDERFK